MSDWVAFEGEVEPLAWGRATYTILRLPGRAGARGGPRAAGHAHRPPLESLAP